MENVEEIVKHVLNVWRLYKTQRQLLSTAMRQEIPFPLRQLLSRDYMICSVLKKEIANLYDALKCCMTGIIRPDGTAAITIDWEGNIILILGEIVSVHQKIIAEYEILLTLLEGSDMSIAMLRHHCMQMHKMTDDLLAESAEP